MTGRVPSRFADRQDAGRRLGLKLATMGLRNVIVLGLPRGGVPVAAEVAAILEAPLDVIIVRKLGIPSHPEVAMGAIGEGGVRVVDAPLLARLGVSDREFARVEAAERETLDRRVAQLRGERRPFSLVGRTALIVDDGIATGATATAACQVARRLGAKRVVLAAPVASPRALEQVTGADDIVVVIAPADFEAVGFHYGSFTQTTDAEVVRLLSTARRIEDADEPLV